MARKSKGSLIGWPGSKRFFAEKIVRYMPETEIYSEFFGGSLAVLLAKARSTSEIVNDGHNELINFMLVVRDKPEELIYKMEFTLSSEGFYKDLERISPLGDVDRAFRFLYLNRQAFSMRMGTTWAVSPGRDSKWKVDYLQNKVRLVHKRLSGVEITCRDYRDMLKIKAMSHPDTLIYLDPPYYKTSSRGYANRGRFNHKKFFPFCKKLKARVMLSHSYHPAVHNYFSDWESVELLTKASHLERKIVGKPKKRYTEMLYSNFPLNNARRRLF